MNHVKTMTLASLGVVLLLAGCASSVPVNIPEFDDTMPARIAAAAGLPGVYDGTLPCADCAGVRTTLYIRADGSYSRISEHVGKDTSDEAGHWKSVTVADKTLVTFEPLSEGASLWSAEKEGVAMHLLDADGRRAEGASKSFFTLKKH